MHLSNTLPRGEGGLQGRERNGGRTDAGTGLLQHTNRKIFARIPHPTSLSLGHLPPGGRLLGMWIATTGLLTGLAMTRKFGRFDVIPRSEATRESVPPRPPLTRGLAKLALRNQF